MNADLHLHSTASDGLLAPAQLVRLACGRGVSLLSLTDHDEVAGLAEAADAARSLGVKLVPGAEISVSWNELTVHVVGLGIDPANPELVSGLASVRASRARRAELIADSLARVGVQDSLQGARAYCANSETLGRTHFARFLVERNYARDVNAVFRRFLARGKPGYVPHRWASLAQSVKWIDASGGIAVMAHPGRYSLSRPQLEGLFAEFAEAGGRGIEVLTGSHAPGQASRFARLAKRFGFAASCGSDYHGPGESRAEPGSLPALPGDLRPVWQLL